MLWLVLVLPLVLLGVGVLALVVLRLWRQVKALGATVRACGDRLAAAGAELDALNRERPRTLHLPR